MNTYTTTAIALPPHTTAPQASDSAVAPRRGFRFRFSIDEDTPFWQAALSAFIGSVGINVVLLLTSGELLGPWDAKFAFNLSIGTAIAGSLWLFGAMLNARFLPRYIDWLRQPWRALSLSLLANVVGVVVIVTVIYFVFFFGIQGWPWEKFLRALRPGNYVFSTLITLVITTIYQAAYFLSIWKAALIQQEQLKTANLTAKYEVLNAQVNPHFLFNSLNVLSALVKRDPDAAEGFIRGLSEVYRYVLDVRGEQLVSLERELHALEAYNHLVLLRFGESRLRIDVAIEPQPGDLVVPLALQMLIENAVKHNGATRKNPLSIEVFRDGGQLVIRNNKVPLFEEVESRGIGLANIRERYGLALGEDVVIEDGDGVYTVRLPLVRASARPSDRSAQVPPLPVGAGLARTR